MSSHEMIYLAVFGAMVLKHYDYPKAAFWALGISVLFLMFRVDSQMKDLRQEIAERSMIRREPMQ